MTVIVGAERGGQVVKTVPLSAESLLTAAFAGPSEGEAHVERNKRATD